MTNEDNLTSLKPICVAKGFRPLYFDGAHLICANYNRIFSTTDLGKSFSLIGYFPDPSPFSSLLRFSPLVRRVLRATIYRLRVMENGNLVFIFKGGIYLLRSQEQVAERVFPITKGSRPVSLAYKPGGLVVFGEYYNNVRRHAIHIYGSKDCGESWKSVYTFSPGSIRHIHGITYDPWEDCFWICTGDYDHEAQVLRASPDFDEIRIILQGGQSNRFYSILALENHLIMVNDSPNADNYVRVLQKDTGKVSNLSRIDNSNFYSCMVGDWFLCSNNAEPAEENIPITCHTPNDRLATHVWLTNSMMKVAEKAVSFPVDHWDRLSRLYGIPNGLFQYPRIFFPEGYNSTGHLVCYALGVKKYDDCMLVYNMDDLKEQIGPERLDQK